MGAINGILIGVYAVVFWHQDISKVIIASSFKHGQLIYDE